MRIILSSRPETGSSTGRHSSSVARSDSGLLGENKNGAPQCDNHRRQPEFLPCPRVCLLYGDRPSWADFYKERTILPVPFATTTTMLEAFVQERVSLTLDRSASRLTMGCRARGPYTVNETNLGGSDCKNAAAALQRDISFVFSNSASEGYVATHTEGAMDIMVVPPPGHEFKSL
jgi:hypothetical protein